MLKRNKLTCLAFGILTCFNAQAQDVQESCTPFLLCPMGYVGDVLRTDEGWHILYAWRQKDNTLKKQGFSCKHGVCDISTFIDKYIGFKSDVLNGATNANKAITVAQSTPIDCTTYQKLCDENKVVYEALKVRAEKELPYYGIKPVLPPPPVASAPIPVVPPASMFIVVPAASNSPDGKKPVYTFIPPNTLKATTLRVLPGTVCGALVYQATPKSGAYHTVQGGVAECVKQ